MPTIPTNPFYYDGNVAITDEQVLAVNSGEIYLYVEDDIGEEVKHTVLEKPNGEPLGSITNTGATGGSLTVQLSTRNQALPRAGYIVLLRSVYYAVSAKISPKRTKGAVVRVSLGLEKVYNPILLSLLSTAGQVLTKALVLSSAMTSITQTIGNQRAGSTLAYSATDLPPGVVINASTGAITGTPTAAGTYTTEVTVTETLAGSDTLAGVGYIKFTVA